MDLPHIFEAENRSSVSGEGYIYSNAGVSVPYLVMLIGATITGTIGNFLIIGVVLTDKNMRSTGNIFICNLALADLCVSLFVDAFNIISVVKGEPWFNARPGLCDTIALICLTACFCSLYSIGTVSFNRYMHICHPHSYGKYFSRNKCIVYCILLWIYSFLLESPNVFGWSRHTFDQKTLTCLWDRTASYSYVLCFAIIGIGLPLVVIAICYIKIFLKVRATKRRIATSGQTMSEKSQRAQRESIRLARTLFIIFAVFTICWFPYAVIIVGDRYDTWPQEVHMFAILIAHVNSSLNSVLYGVTNKNFRQGYIRLVRLDKCWPSILDRAAVDNTIGERTDNRQNVQEVTMGHGETVC